MSQFFYNYYTSCWLSRSMYYSNIGNCKCQICGINVSTQFKLLHGFNYHGTFTCNDDSCISYAEEHIDDLFTKYPIYNLNLNRDNIIIPNNDVIWSTVKPEDYKYDMTKETVGSTFLIGDNFYITLFDKTYMSSWSACIVFDLKEIYENNQFNDEEIVSFPDSVKEYLGIKSFSLKFVD
jgi:hypothetical protein